MKHLLIAAIPALLMSACGTTAPATNTAAAASAGTYYCWQAKMHDSGGKVACNWTNDRDQACYATLVTSMDKSALAGEPAKTRRCENGEWLVMVQKK